MLYNDFKIPNYQTVVSDFVEKSLPTFYVFSNAGLPNDFKYKSFLIRQSKPVLANGAMLVPSWPHKLVLCSVTLPPVWPVKNRQMSIKVA